MNQETIEIEKQMEEKKEHFIGRDIFESYLYYRNYISSNANEEYITKRKCIEFGKELLPTDKDGEEQEKIDKIYKDACKALNSEIPEQRNIEYGYSDQGGKRHNIYILKSDDAEVCHAEPEKIDLILGNFVEQQHEQHLGNLQDVDNKIFHELVIHKIIKKEDPPLKKLREEKRKQRFLQKKGENKK